MSFLLCVALTWARETIDCDELKHLIPGKVIAIGPKKQVSEATWDATPVLVTQPWKGPWFDAHSSQPQVEAVYEAYFRGERDELRAATSDFLPHFYGGCWESLWTSRNVLEYVEGWMNIVQHASLDFHQRLILATNALNLVSLFDRFPIPGPGGARHVIPNEYHPQLFGANATYHVKLVSHNQPKLAYYAGSALGADEPCASHSDCFHHFVNARGVGGGLLSPEPPKDFDCNLETKRCRGLDRRLHIYAVAHVLLKPLFGIGGHLLPGGIVSDFYRPKVEEIVYAAASPDPDDRPRVSDLQNALLAIVQGDVAPYFVPHNADVNEFVKLRDLHDRFLTGGVPLNATRWAEPIIEVETTKHASHKHDPPIALSDWFFKFQPTPQLPMTVRLLGVYNGQPWGSSPIFVRQNATLLQTRSGKMYSLVGLVKCEGLTTEGFSDDICRKFRHGFPFHWKGYLSEVWNQRQTTLREEFFKHNAPEKALNYDHIHPADVTVSSYSDSERASSSDPDTDAQQSWMSGSGDADWLSSSDHRKSEAPVDKESPQDAAAAQKLLKQERDAKAKEDAKAKSSPCGLEGLLSGNVCCLSSCGSCGGVGCESRHGGRAGCCPDQILKSELSCSDNLPPCILRTPKAAAPKSMSTKPVAPAVATPPTIKTPSDPCDWSPPSDQVPSFTDATGTLGALVAPEGTAYCVLPSKMPQRWLVPDAATPAARTAPVRQVDLSVHVLKAPVEMVIGLSVGTSPMFQNQTVVLRLDADTSAVEVAGRKGPIFKVAQDGVYLFRVEINDSLGGATVQAKDITKRGTMGIIAANAPFVSKSGAVPFTSSSATPSRVRACEHRLGFVTLLRKGLAQVCVGPPSRVN